MAGYSDELEALRTIYSDASLVCSSSDDLGVSVKIDFGEPRLLSAVLHIPRGYPNDAASIVLLSADGLPRSAVAAVNERIGDVEVVDREPHLMPLVETCCDATAASRAAMPSSLASGVDADQVRPSCEGHARVWVWLHHIMAPHKRRCIEVWAAELGVAGVCKPGFPGVIIAHGRASAVDEYIARLKALRWQAMVVREEERWEDTAQATARESPGLAVLSSPATGVSTAAAVYTSDPLTSADSAMVMLGEGDMDAVAAVAARWDRLALFRQAILRLSTPVPSQA